MDRADGNLSLLRYGWTSTGSRERFFSWLTYWGPLLAALGLAAFVFHFLKHNLYVQTAGHASPPIITLAIAAVAISGIWLSPQQLTAAARIFYRVSSLLVGFYLVAGDVPLPSGADPAIVEWFGYASWLAFAAAVLSFWRPTLALLPFGILVMQKGLASQAWGLSITPTDWAPVVEATSFLLISATLTVGLSAVCTGIWRVQDEASAEPRLPLVDALVIVAIGIHFANYFWSGIEKATLDGGPLSWLLENRTDYLMKVATDSGFFSLTYGFPFSDPLRTLVTGSLLPLNAVTFVVQLACIAVFWRRSWIVALTLIYDLQHVMIFLLTGIFFWKWIIFNVALVAAASRLPSEKIPLLVGLLGAATCLLANHLFFVAKLGWYDTRAYNQLHMLAVVDDGREVPVPTNFFGPLSVSMAQMDYAYEWPDALNVGTWGSTTHDAQRRSALGCEVATGHSRGQKAGVRPLGDLLKEWHKVVLTKVNAAGHLNYDLYPHHIWSDPRRFKEFSALDLHKVVGYRVVLEKKCLDGVADGTPILLAKGERLVSIAPSPTFASDGDNATITTGSIK